MIQFNKIFVNTIHILLIMRIGLSWQLKSFFTTNPRKSYYQIMRLTQSASHEQIKTNYYKLAKQYHPDVNFQKPQQFKLLVEAYDTLKDPVKRQKYDQQIRQTPKTGSADNFNAKSSTRGSYNSGANFHYGYQHRNQNMRNAKPKYDNSYADQARKTYKFNFDEICNLRRKKKLEDNLKRQAEELEMQRGTIKWSSNLKKKFKQFYVVVFGVISVVLMAQTIITIHRYNAIVKKNSYYQRLDPNQI